MFPIIETDRLILREITNDDAEGIFSIFSNELVTRYYGQNPLNKKEQAIALVDHFSKIYREKRGIRWGIERKGSEGIIGTIGFNNWSPNYKRAEIGYELHPDFWRKGYANEAIQGVLSYGFHHLDLNRIGAVVITANEASSSLLLKLGFQKEGILQQYIVQNGIAYDTFIYAILKDHFK